LKTAEGVRLLSAQTDLLMGSKKLHVFLGNLNHYARKVDRFCSIPCQKGKRIIHETVLNYIQCNALQKSNRYVHKRPYANKGKIFITSSWAELYCTTSKPQVTTSPNNPSRPAHSTSNSAKTDNKSSSQSSFSSRRPMILHKQLIIMIIIPIIMQRH
jgi:hypothetical protein